VGRRLRSGDSPGGQTRTMFADFSEQDAARYVKPGSRILRGRVARFSGGLGLGFCGLLLRRTGFVKGKAAQRAAWVWRLRCSIYIFTVRGSDSLKLRVDSAGRMISLLPV